MDGEATAAQMERLPRRAPHQGRDAGRDRRLRGSHAFARARRAPAADGSRRHRGHRGRRRADVQHLDRGRARRRGRGRGRREARQPLRLSASGSADVLEALGFELELPAERIERSIDELGFGFLFAPLTTRPCAMRRPSAASSRADGLQRARAADEPRRGSHPGRGGVLAGAQGDGRRGSCSPRGRARVRRPRRGRHRRAVTGRAESRLGGRGERARAAPHRPAGASGFRAASPIRPRRRLSGGERGHDSRIFAGADAAATRGAVPLNAAAAIAAAGPRRPARRPRPGRRGGRLGGGSASGSKTTTNSADRLLGKSRPRRPGGR